MLGFVTLSLLVLPFTLWILWRKKQFSYFVELGIPGPKPNIFFGNFLEIVKRTPLTCSQEWKEKYGSVYGYYWGARPMLVVSDPELLKIIQIKDFKKFIDRPLLNAPSRDKLPFGKNIANMIGQEWKKARSMLTPSFTTGKMKNMNPLMNKSTDELLENIDVYAKSGQFFDIYPLYQQLTLDVITKTAFGLRTNVQKNPNNPFLKSFRSILGGDLSSWMVLLTICFPEFHQILRPFGKIMLRYKNKGLNPFNEIKKNTAAVIKARKNDPSLKQPDLLQSFLDAQVKTNQGEVTAEELTAGTEESDDTNTEVLQSEDKKNVQGIPDEEIISHSVAMLLAGYETTSTSLAFVTQMLVNYEDVQEKLYQEIEDVIEECGEINYDAIQKLQYMDQVISESVRMYPPIYQFVNRETTVDTQVDKYRIPKGLAIRIPTYILHHDEKYWPDHMVFDPERFSPDNRKNYNPIMFQPFGAGPRNCIGMRFAQMEMKLTLAKLLHKYKIEKCSKTEQDPIPLRINQALIAPKNGVHVVAVPR